MEKNPFHVNNPKAIQKQISWGSKEVHLEKNEAGIESNVNAVHVTVIAMIALVAITSLQWIEKLTEGYNKKRMNTDLKISNDQLPGERSNMSMCKICRNSI